MIEKADTRMALETPRDLFAKLRWEEDRLTKTWGVYESYNFVVTAWHLYSDWLKTECGASAEQLERKKLLSQGAKDVFGAVRDLANGAKHWKMTKTWSLNEQVVTKVEGPVIGDWLSFVDDRPMMYITFTDYSLSIAELSAFVMRYFEWIFDGEGSVFPDELTNNLEALRLTNIP